MNFIKKQSFSTKIAQNYDNITVFHITRFCIFTIAAIGFIYIYSLYSNKLFILRNKGSKK